jgi:hypothetical protein
MANDVNVGDVVAWDKVPDGALVRDADGWHALRMRGRGVYVGEPGEDWLSADPWDDDGRWSWNNADHRDVTVICVGLTGQETAAELQRLAEVFEVWEALVQEDGVSLLKAAAEVPTHRHLWVPADGIDFIPAVCSRAFGDGRALLALSTINHRPRFYVIRIDSTWRDLVEDEHIDSIYDALLEEFGDAEQVEADEPRLEWPAFDGANGSSWWRLEWSDFAKRLHRAGWRPGMTAEDAARMLEEAGR